MSHPPLHKVQAAILYTLRHTEAVRFSDLMRPTDLSSDVFKFHLRKLVDQKYVEKLPSGEYALTSTGKEFANNFNESQRTIQKQPKVSLLLVVPSPENSSQYLFQQRARSPYHGFWSCIAGPAQWGEAFEETAVRELTKQTGLTATLTVRSFYRKRDYIANTSDLLEDKLFVVLEATNVQGTLSNAWHGGHNQWMTIETFKQTEKHFDSASEVIELIEKGRPYVSAKAEYTLEEY